MPFTLRLHAPTRQVEVFGDCGLPCPGQELALYRHLLELALESELPALRFALHPVSGHVVVRGSLALAQRQEGELCAALLVLATAQAQELRQKFDWEAQTKAA